MKRLRSILIAILLAGTSQVSMSQNAIESFKKHSVFVVQPKTVILNAQGRAKKIVKSKARITVDDDDVIVVQEDDLATGYRRRDLNKIEHEDGISEKVRWRLFLARQLAMLKYREVRG